MRVDIELQRCVCIHSLSQIVDITLQVLLYQRRIIPLPVQNLLIETNQKSDKFKNLYQEITNIIRTTFCFYNRYLISEFLILIGPTPYLPKEIYRIPICACSKHNLISVGSDNADQENQAKTKDGCGKHCQALTEKEIRQIFLAITLNKTASNLFATCPTCSTDKVFFFIKSIKTKPIILNIDGIEEDESFELPTIETIKRRKIKQLQLNIRSICLNEINQTLLNNLNLNNTELNDNENSIKNGDDKWFRIIQFIGRFV